MMSLRVWIDGPKLYVARDRYVCGGMTPMPQHAVWRGEVEWVEHEEGAQIEPLFDNVDRSRDHGGIDRNLD